MHDPLLVGPFGGSISQVCLQPTGPSSGTCSTILAATATLDFVALTAFTAGFAAAATLDFVALAAFTAGLAAAATLDFVAVLAGIEARVAFVPVLGPVFVFEAVLILPEAVAGFFVANERSSQRLSPSGVDGNSDSSSVRAASGAKKEARRLTRKNSGQLRIIPDRANDGPSASQRNDLEGWYGEG